LYQSLARRRYILSAAWWWLATLLAGAAFWPTRHGISKVLSAAFCTACNSNIGDDQTRTANIHDAQVLAANIGITVAFLLWGAITGLTLALLLRKPSTKAV